MAGQPYAVSIIATQLPHRWGDDMNYFAARARVLLRAAAAIYFDEKQRIGL